MAAGDVDSVVRHINYWVAELLGMQGTTLHDLSRAIAQNLPLFPGTLDILTGLRPQVCKHSCRGLPAAGAGLIRAGRLSAEAA